MKPTILKRYLFHKLKDYLRNSDKFTISETQDILHSIYKVQGNNTNKKVGN